MEKETALLASGVLPDIVIFKSAENMRLAAEGGMLVDLDQYIDLLPTCVENMGMALDYSRDFYGGLYVIPWKLGDYYAPFEVTVNSANLLRWDLYQAIGAPEIHTLEDLIPLYQQMLEIYPTSEDGQKTYALGRFPDWDHTYPDITVPVLNALGYYEGFAKYGVDYKISTGEITPITDDSSAYLRTLRFLYECNQAGVLDPETLTQTYATYSQRARDGVYLSTNYDTPTADQYTAGIGYMPVWFDEYELAINGGQTVANTLGFGVSSSCENVEKAVELLNLVSSVEMQLVHLNGPEGLYWEYGENGQPKATEAYYEAAATGEFIMPTGETYEYENIFMMYEAGKYVAPGGEQPLKATYWADVTERNSQGNMLYSSWQEFYGAYSPIEKLQAEERYQPRPSAIVSFMPVVPDDINSIISSYAELMNTQCYQMIFAKDEVEFNSIWESFKSDMLALGMDQVQQWCVGAVEEAFATYEKYAG